MNDVDAAEAFVIHCHHSGHNSTSIIRSSFHINALARLTITKEFLGQQKLADRELNNRKNKFCPMGAKFIRFAQLGPIQSSYSQRAQRDRFLLDVALSSSKQTHRRTDIS